MKYSATRGKVVNEGQLKEQSANHISLNYTIDDVMESWKHLTAF